LNSFKNYLPLFDIAVFLLVAVNGEIEIGIRITPQGIKMPLLSIVGTVANWLAQALAMTQLVGFHYTKQNLNM
jgi:hypothetical protein